MYEEQTLTNPTFDALSFKLIDDRDSADSFAGVAASVIEEVLGAGWNIEPLNSRFAPRSFSALRAEDLDPARAWDLSYLVAEDHRVEWAEPVFEFDVVGEVDDPEDEPADDELQTFGSTEDPSDREWSLKLIQARDAWHLHPPTGGQSRGRGVLIGHPDSGFKEHPELGQNFLRPGRDFVDPQSPTAENPNGQHGLGTASVIMSQDNRTAEPRSVTGVAPLADLIPYRVAEKRLLAPVPVLFRSGMRRLAKAIYRAIEQDCHVISISLGWLKNQDVQDALRFAVRDHQMIVVAAAGNFTYRLVVWPAAYPEAIALAACDAKRRRWRWSARGPKVEFTAPGHKVWRADEDDYSVQSSGTSHATATTAGLAALWLAYHGRENLLSKYQEHGVLLSDVFRWVLRESCDPPPRDNGRWGHGIINAKQCLEQDLPRPEQIAGHELQHFGAEPAQADSLTGDLDAVPKDLLEERFSQLLSVPQDRFEELATQRRDELLFLALTRPEARSWLLRSEDAAENVEGDLQTFGDASSSAPTLSGFSQDLQKRIQEMS